MKSKSKNKWAWLLAGLLAAAPSLAQPTAQQWNREVKAGWNLGNQFECSPVGTDAESIEIGEPDGADNAETSWGNPVVTKKTIKAVRDAGFDAVRIPVRWQHHVTNAAAMSVSKTWMARVKEVIDWCLAYDLKVIVNVHHDKWLESRPLYAHKDENCQKLALLWMNIATELNHYDYRVAFAGTNEVHEPDNWGKPTAENLDVQNAYNQTFVDIVRATGMNNSKRHLIVQTYVCEADYGVYNGDLVIPTDIEGNGLDYMSVEFHYYKPWDYCGLGKLPYWGKAYTGRDDEKDMADFFDRAAREWGARGLGVVIGEWGVSDHYEAGQADRGRESQAHYCQTLIAEARKRGFSTFLWDNNRFGNGADMFGVFDRNKGMAVKAPWMIEGIKRGIAAGEH